MVTWLQLGFHEKPVALLNINGFYEHLLGFFDHCVTEVHGFALSLDYGLALSLAAQNDNTLAHTGARRANAGCRALCGLPVVTCSSADLPQPRFWTRSKRSSVSALVHDLTIRMTAMPCCSCVSLPGSI